MCSTFVFDSELIRATPIESMQFSTLLSFMAQGFRIPLHVVHPKVWMEISNQNRFAGTYQVPWSFQLCFN